MTQEVAFQEIGVVEGFYGRVWDRAEREAFITNLLPFGLNTYLYAPKHDVALGLGLLNPLTESDAERITALAEFCGARSVGLWLGLHLEPPFDPGQYVHLERLAEKGNTLAALGIQGLAILFDDVPAPEGEEFGGSMAAAQAHAFNTFHQGLGAKHGHLQWVVCPSRYSLDPLIEEQHGAFEVDYLERLHQAMPPEVPWLWTGPKVCSPTIALSDQEDYLAQAGPQGTSRPLILWDNYPVNDAAMIPWLHLDPLGGRDQALPGVLRGYLFNPLLQPALGAIPGATCLIYANDPAGYRLDAAWESAVTAFLPPELHRPFAEFAALIRPSRPTGGLPPGWPRGSFPLAARLQRGWEAMSTEKPAEIFVVKDFQRVLDTLQRGLPEAMLAEAGPWLARLRQALTLFDSIQAGAPVETLGPLRAQYVARDSKGPPAEVLGDWFP